MLLLILLTLRFVYVSGSSPKNPCGKCALFTCNGENLLFGTCSAEDGTVKEMKKIEDDRFQKELEMKPNLQSIPTFYFQKNIPSVTDMGENRKGIAITQLLQREARNRFIESKKKLILVSNELDRLWEVLLKNATPPVLEGDEKINYDGFMRVMEETQEESKVKEYVNADIFLRFFRDEVGRISIPAFFNYILRKVSLIQSKVSFSSYDSDGDNYVTENDIECLIYESIPQIASLKGMHKRFQKHYVHTATRKFMFFLDGNKRGKIHIDDILSSQVLVEFNELQNEEITTEEERNNWFSIASSMSVYDTFVKLDAGRKGMLSKDDFIKFNGGSLTRTFVERLFQESPTKDGKVDYKIFVDFLLAYENKNTPASIAYFWKILDVEKQGYLTPFSINFFFRDIQKKLEHLGAETVKTIDILEELYSMVKPSKDRNHIYLQDLQKSGCGGTVISMLIDVQAFWNYDNRESMMQDKGGNS